MVISTPTLFPDSSWAYLYTFLYLPSSCTLLSSCLSFFPSFLLSLPKTCQNCPCVQECGDIRCSMENLLVLTSSIKNDFLPLGSYALSIALQ